MAKMVNCLIVDDEPVARQVLIKHLDNIDTVNLVASCKSAVEALNIISESDIDLIFLDINMPQVSGLSFAKSTNRNIKIIFTTAYREYAVDGFDLQAVDYLLKPISYERLLQAVNKYMNEKQTVAAEVDSKSKKELSESMFVRSDRKMIKICFGDIRYIESVGDYIRIYMAERSVVTRETLTSIEVKLPQKRFVRTHRSFIVAVDYIESFTNEQVEVAGKEIPISRSFKDQVLRKLENS